MLVVVVVVEGFLLAGVVVGLKVDVVGGVVVVLEWIVVWRL